MGSFIRLETPCSGARRNRAAAHGSYRSAVWRWPVAINRLWQAGLIPDVWFWQQGQSDADVTSATVYRDKLWALVAFMRAYDICCPFGIIKNSWINGVHANVREGQDLAVSESLGVSIAYDSDAFGLAYRSTPTDAHWNDAGQV